MNKHARYPHFDTLIEYFYHYEVSKANEVMFRQPKGDQWKTVTFAQAGQEARRMATALKSMGLEKGDKVAIYSKNCYHWIMADLAIMIGGFVSVPLYASLPRPQFEVVLKKSDAKAVFVGKLDGWGDRAEAVPEGMQIIRFPHYEGNAQVSQGQAWEELIAQHEPQSENFVPDPESLWTILFTSGTTGSPKGVMHAHKTPANIAKDEFRTSWLHAFQGDEHRMFSYLPLNHVGERVGVQTIGLAVGASFSFAENLDTFAKNLQETQPTLFFAVPRIWTKFYQGVLAKMPQKRLDLMLSIPIVSGMVRKKLLKALGMSKARVIGTGAAITPAYLKEWYSKLGLHLIEAYGMTEVCGSMCNSPMKDAPYDSVGKAIPDGEVKIDPETGEILMKSKYMMMGYYKEPEITAKVLKGDWLHSGDRGEIDEQGFLRVIGRVKDAFKTAKGSYVTPNPMEEFIGEHDFVEQICVAGIGLPQPIALVNLSEIGRNASPEELEASLMERLKELNKSLAAYEKISTIIVDPEDWSPDNGMLTPTLKVKRGSIDKKHGANYEAWHAAKEKVIWLKQTELVAK